MPVYIRKRQSSRYEFTADAISDLEGLYWAIDYPAIMDMIDKAHTIDKSKYNKQCQDMLFAVTGTVVHKVKRNVHHKKRFVACVSCQDTGQVKVYNLCGHCNGIGCGRCEDGYTQGYIPCQDPNCSVNRTAQVIPRNGYRNGTKPNGKSAKKI